MSADAAPPMGPDLEEGIARSGLKEGEPFFGHVGDSPVYVLLDRAGGIRAYSAVCTHYGAPLADGVRKDEELVALGTVFQDRLSLETEAELESGGGAEVRAFDVDD